MGHTITARGVRMRKRLDRLSPQAEEPRADDIRMLSFAKTWESALKGRRFDEPGMVVSLRKVV